MPRDFDQLPYHEGGAELDAAMSGTWQAPDTSAAVCRYCGCMEDRPCLLSIDTNERLARVSQRTQAQPCMWHRIVKQQDLTGRTSDLFAVCSNASCVRAYLSDPRAP
jgi:hypothetical protein